MTTVDCPRCRKMMDAVSLPGVAVDVCRVCEGIWFDNDELGRAFSAAAGEPNEALKASWEGQPRGGEQAGRHELSCPRCTGRLARYRYAGTTDILVDGCERGCGVWVDDGEIKRIFEQMAENAKDLPAGELKRLKGALHAAEGDRALKEMLYIENLTKLDDRSGPVGAIGVIIQFVYGAFYKAGFR